MARRLFLGFSAVAAVVLVTLATGCARADAEITTEVKVKIDADRNLTSKMMQVDTKKGVVTLTGSAASDSERKQAEQLARTTDGVKDVVDNMTVNPTLAPVPTDAAGNAALPSPATGPAEATPAAGVTTTPASQ